jgi:hypothetical protein
MSSIWIPLALVRTSRWWWFLHIPASGVRLRFLAAWSGWSAWLSWERGKVTHACFILGTTRHWVAELERQKISMSCGSDIRERHYRLFRKPSPGFPMPEIKLVEFTAERAGRTTLEGRGSATSNPKGKGRGPPDTASSGVLLDPWVGVSHRGSWTSVAPPLIPGEQRGKDQSQVKYKLKWSHPGSVRASWKYEQKGSDALEKWRSNPHSQDS